MEVDLTKPDLDAQKPPLESTTASTSAQWPRRVLEVRRNDLGQVMRESWPFRSPTRRRNRDEIDAEVRGKIRAAVRGEIAWPLAFVGEAGSGKSCAALCLCDNSGLAAYVAASDLCRMIREGMEAKLVGENGYAISDRQVWDGWEKANVAVLDELGTREKASDFQYETIKRAIDLRLDYERPLVVISNHTMGDLAKCYDDRIASRIGSGTVIGFTGDRRFGEL